LDGCLLGLFWTVAFFGGSLFGDIVIKDPKTKTKLQGQQKNHHFQDSKKIFKFPVYENPKQKKQVALMKVQISFCIAASNLGHFQ
jgi:hypothetical protein